MMYQPNYTQVIGPFTNQNNILLMSQACRRSSPTTTLFLLADHLGAPTRLIILSGNDRIYLNGSAGKLQTRFFVLQKQGAQYVVGR
jgi:hypothetical protein